jgi:hypothetical protein
MNTIDKLNNTLGYLTAMSFDRPELSNDLVEPLNTLSEAISEVENLSLSGVGSSFICVKDQKPPKNTELIAQDPKGVNYLTSWRESYRIFMCQSKQEDSSNWRWKQI